MELDVIVAALQKGVEQVSAKIEAVMRTRQCVAETYARTMEPNPVGLTPTVDYQGRLHAPAGGYVLVTESLGEVVYAGGEYMVVASLDKLYASDISYKQPKRTFRIKFPLDVANSLAALDLKNYVKVGLGKPWNTKEGTFCYTYFETEYATFYPILEDIVNDVIASTKKGIKETEQKILASNAKAPTGRVEITGTVVRVYVRETPYGYVTKMVVELDSGIKLFGTLPKALSDVEEGQTVSFTATFTENESNPTQAFFKRPSKAKIHG